MFDLGQLKKGLFVLVSLVIIAFGAFYFINQRHENDIVPVKTGAVLPLEALLEEVGLDTPKDKLLLVNFFASWCEGCRMEHERLIALSKLDNVMIIGVAFQDKLEQVEEWLKQSGNPYSHVFYDQSGKYAIDWGIYGVPESFFVDGKGKLLFRHQGVLFPHHLTDFVEPLVKNFGVEKG